MLESPEEIRQIGRYKILRELGQGAMAQVYLAELETLGGFRRKVALKIVKSEFARDPKFAQLMAREAMIGSRLQHPNIVETLEFNEADGRMFLALEFVEGETIEELLTKAEAEGSKGLPLDLALEIIIQVLKGLEYAHRLSSSEGEEMGIIHRDLKPGNIMVSRHGSVKVMDFGIAKAKVACATITAAGQVRGTPIYMAPEQVTGKPLDGRCDQFAAATVMYELITGQQLFIARNLIEIMRRVSRADAGEAIRHLERRQPGLGAIAETMWAVSVNDRYPDCGEAARALEDLLPAVRRTMANPELAETGGMEMPLDDDEDEEPTIVGRRPAQLRPHKSRPGTAVRSKARPVPEPEEEPKKRSGFGLFWRRKEKVEEPPPAPRRKKKRRTRKRRSEESGRIQSPEQTDGVRRRRRKKRRTGQGESGAQRPPERSATPPQSQPASPPPKPPSEPFLPDTAEADVLPDETRGGMLKPEPSLAAAASGPIEPPTPDEPTIAGERRPEVRGGDDTDALFWEETTFGDSSQSGIEPVSPAALDETTGNYDPLEAPSAPALRPLNADIPPTLPVEIISPTKPVKVTLPVEPTRSTGEAPVETSTAVTWERPNAGLRTVDEDETVDEAEEEPMDSFFFED